MPSSSLDNQFETIASFNAASYTAIQKQPHLSQKHQPSHLQRYYEQVNFHSASSSSRRPSYADQALVRSSSHIIQRQQTPDFYTHQQQSRSQTHHYPLHHQHSVSISEPSPHSQQTLESRQQSTEESSQDFFSHIDEFIEEDVSLNVSFILGNCVEFQAGVPVLTSNWIRRTKKYHNFEPDTYKT